MDADIRVLVIFAGHVSDEFHLLDDLQRDQNPGRAVEPLGEENRIDIVFVLFGDALTNDVVLERARSQFFNEAGACELLSHTFPPSLIVSVHAAERSSSAAGPAAMTSYLGKP
jgi:hypothetical protein